MIWANNCLERLAKMSFFKFRLLDQFFCFFCEIDGKLFQTMYVKTTKPGTMRSVMDEKVDIDDNERYELGVRID
jgi:hypothetical protein